MRKILPLIALAALAGCRNNITIKLMPYPVARMDSVVDNYHGTPVADPYRWLEDDNSPETKAWVEAENKLTYNYLSQIPYREEVRKRLSELWNYERFSIPAKVGEYYFFTKNDGLQNQSVLYRQAVPDGKPEVFLDPNALSDDGTVALVSVSFSESGQYMAYSLAASGSDWVRIKVRDCLSGADLQDSIEWVKFSGASWGADSKGFYYSRYDEPQQGQALSGQNRDQKVYYHRLGEPQEHDKLIYSDPENPLLYFSARESRDGRYVFVDVEEGTHGTEIFFRSARSSKFTKLFRGFAYDYMFVDCIGDRAFFLTNDKAPNYRLVGVDLRNPANVYDVIPENAEVLLEDVNSVGGYFMATYLQDAQNMVVQYTTEGEFIGTVDLPAIGTARGFFGKPDSKETFYLLTNFVMPPVVYRYDLEAGDSKVFAKPQLRYNPDKFTVDQVFFTSKDSTRVPMFVAHRKDMVLDGSNPLYLYGYGGFNNSLTPSFSPSAIMLMEQGGIFVMVNLRGGGEYGEKWHRAGMLGKKQNVFDDFIAAAEYLIEHKYTSEEKIGIAGGSNGGLLVGACMTQRPDLFAVALPAVGVMDMLRYHKFTVGWGWAVEYGSSDDKDQFEYLYKYSPLHNIRPDVNYPATLITTADHDDRVVPAHSFKFAATLQAAQGSKKPVLIRVDTNAGHGAGKPTSKRIDEAADVYSFFLWNTKANVKLAK